MSGTDGGTTDDGLKNPMRFSIRNRRIDIGEKLRHPDLDEKQVTEIQIQDGQLYVHWEWSEDAEGEMTDSEVEGAVPERYEEKLTPLRETIADGQIEGVEYKITSAVRGGVFVEFAEETRYVYSLEDLLLGAWRVEQECDDA
jgi:hypothetical protein